MQVVLKWEIERPQTLNTYTQTEMPQGTEILCVQEHRGHLAVWGVVEKGSTPATRLLFLRGTGQPFNIESDYIGTVQFDGGSWVVHVFDGGEAPS